MDACAAEPPGTPGASGPYYALAGALGCPEAVRSDGAAFVLLLFTPDDTTAFAA